MKKRWIFLLAMLLALPLAYAYQTVDHDSAVLFLEISAGILIVMSIIIILLKDRLDSYKKLFFWILSLPVILSSLYYAGILFLNNIAPISNLSISKMLVIVITSVVDSINPCAIGVLVLLISSLLVTKRKSAIFKVCFFYIFSVYATYFLYGLFLTAFMEFLPTNITQYVFIAIGLAIIAAGLIEIKDYFWYGKGFSLMIPHVFLDKIKDGTRDVSVFTSIFLGMFVATVELPCTGGPYLAITLLLAQSFDITALILLLIYNFIFVLPLILILLLVLFGVKIQRVHNWKQNSKPYMRYFTGILLIALGWLLMLIASGVIKLI